MARSSQIIWILFKTLIFTVFVPGTVGVWIPHRIGGSGDIRTIFEQASELRYVSGVLFLLMGGLIYLWCAWDFSVKGLGTPAPIDAPKTLVVNGLYRFVRNPMYLGVAYLISAQSILRSSHSVFYYLIFFLICAQLFVSFYEEPHLRRLFGEQYEEYCRQVPRWIPQFKGYHPPTT
jgi:protein-S-isoprenylcysteine O-methyltransferase Ste14